MLLKSESGESKSDLPPTEGLNIGLLAGIGLIVLSGFVLLGATGAILVIGGAGARRFV